jgi:hypothetical protein
MHVRLASDGSMTNAYGAAEIAGLSFAGFATIDIDAASCDKNKEIFVARCTFHYLETSKANIGVRRWVVFQQSLSNAMLVELLQSLIPEVFVGRAWDVPGRFPERSWSLKRWSALFRAAGPGRPERVGQAGPGLSGRAGWVVSMTNADKCKTNRRVISPVPRTYRGL